MTRFQPVTGHQKRSDGADGPRLVDRRHPAEDGPQHDKDQGQRRHQREREAAKESAVERAAMHRRGHFRPDQRIDENIKHIKADQHQARDQRAQKHLARAG